MTLLFLAEKEMATHSSTLAWRNPWTEELDGLQSMGLQRVRHSWATNTFTFEGREPARINWESSAVSTRLWVHWLVKTGLRGASKVSITVSLFTNTFTFMVWVKGLTSFFRMWLSSCLTLFVESSCLGSLVKQSIDSEWLYFWILSFILLVYMSIMIPVPHVLDS